MLRFEATLNTFAEHGEAGLRDDARATAQASVKKLAAARAIRAPIVVASLPEQRDASATLSASLPSAGQTRRDGLER